MIARKTALKRSTAALRRSKPPARARRSPAGVQKRLADREWAEAVKRGKVCAGLGRNISSTYGTHIGCGPWPVDAAHVMSRTFPATRHDPGNGMPLCRGVHRYFTERPLAWERFCRSLLGDYEYERLYRLAHGQQG